MCGIAGFASSSLKSTDYLQRIALKMSDAIRHRGPDGDGVWTDAEQGIAVSHRRLAIVDLSPAGSQPMISSCGNLVMVYNGEVYNAEELRNELAPLGISFRGTSDTEVILEACARWGIRKTTEKLIGMFAMAIWNRQEQVLTLARDRLGIKPLYWSNNSGSLIFGSELKALRQHPDCPTELNRNAIAGYIRNSYINNPATIYRGVHQLQPGWIMRWKAHAIEPTFEQYWSLKEVVDAGQRIPFEGGDQEAIEHLDTLLGDAVSRRMMADVPLGAFLSGGIDSSTVAALMQKASLSPVKTFSIGFNEHKYDESAYAAAVANHLGTDHTELFMTAEDALNVIPDLPTIYDEPFADASQIPTYLVSRLTREHVTVALSGDGGDELFAGYQRYFDAHKMRHIVAQPKLLQKLEATALERLPQATVNKFGALLPGSIGNKLQGSQYKQLLIPVLKEGTMTSLYRRYLSHSKSPADLLVSGSEITNTPWKDAENIDFGEDGFSVMQYIDTLDYLPDDILTKVDRASMANSLEARVPLLDHRVVEFSWTLPQHMKVRDGAGKWILRNVLCQYVPPSLIDRPKKGFGIPMGTWLRGPLKDWAEDLLSESSLKNIGIFNSAPIRKAWKDHLTEDVNLEYHLWGILSLQAWAIHNNISQ